MIRIANPGSDINQMLKIFRIIFANFSGLEYFSLDNMGQIMTTENVASSSGFIGSVAFAKSYEKIDKSRNPIYNQAKMYAEIYRTLGWIVSSTDKALNFNFTFLGIQVANAGESAKKIFEQCLLGITFPNHTMDVKFDECNKPFVSILLFADQLEDRVCRDEIILTSQCVVDFFDETEFLEKVNYIKQLRKDGRKTTLREEKEKLSEKIGISPTTMENYTRFIISSLVYTGWFKKVKIVQYGRKNDFLSLTDKGKLVVNNIKKINIVNTAELEKLSEEEQLFISRKSFFQMLDRSDFIVDQELSELEDKDDTEYLFSPYQFFDGERQKLLFPDYYSKGVGTITFSTADLEFQGQVYDLNFVNNLTPVSTSSGYTNSAYSWLLTTYEKEKSVNEAIVELLSIIKYYKQTQFYPFVAEIIQIIFNSPARAPQAGVNNERFDVIIPDDQYSIPIEVKSPTEEEKLSVKAIRQALENKIVIQSRYSEVYKTTPSLSSLAIGYSVPEIRSDVYMLIEDIHKTYGINIGIIDIEELLKAAYNVILNQKSYKLVDLEGSKGVIKFENF